MKMKFQIQIKNYNMKCNYLINGFFKVIIFFLITFLIK